MRPPVLVVSAFLLAALGCTRPSPPGLPPATDDGGTDPSAPKLESLALEPLDAVLRIESAAPASLTFKAIATYDDGHTEDVTARTRFFSSDLSIGDFAQERFTAGGTRGGKLKVSAHLDALRAETGLSVVIARSATDSKSSDLPAALAEKFAGPADPSRAPELVYPNDGVLLPPNLGRLEVHFYPKPNNTLFELSFQNALTDVKVYLRCATPLNGGCIHELEPEVWRWLATTNRGGEPVSVVVRGTDDDGSAVGTSAPLKLSFAYEDLAGGLYYWTTSQGTAVMRFDFASPQLEAEKFIDAAAAGGVCIGCHALSRDGKKLVAKGGVEHDGRLLLLDVAKREPIVPFGQPDWSIFESWNPDGSQYVGVYGDAFATNFNLLLFNGSTGKQEGVIEGTGSFLNPADHPDWAPDGSRIAYTRVGIKGTLQRMGKGSIELITRTSTGWSAPTVLAPPVAGKNRYYPAFAPDSSFLVFDESTCPSGDQHTHCNADTDPSARLFAVRASGGPLIALDQANAPGKADQGNLELTNSFPKWSPFIGRRTSEPTTKVAWLTFSSTRRYGLREPPPAPPPPIGSWENSKGTLLWMVAIDPDQVALDQDPSYPAFALPFQDLTTSNHIAQWATRVVPPIN